MHTTETTLNLTYEELLGQTREMLLMYQKTSATPMTSFDKGINVGTIHLWFKLALQMPVVEIQIKEDYRQLRLLAGLPADEQEQPADAR